MSSKRLPVLLTVELTEEAEAEFYRCAIACGGYPVDRDGAALHSAVRNVIAEAEAILEAVKEPDNIIQDHVPGRYL